MKYKVTIPCRPRMIDGVDENMKMYRWCRDHLYEFVGYEKYVRDDGLPVWSWVMEKVLTDREEKIALQAFELGKAVATPRPISPPRPMPEFPKPYELVRDDLPDWLVVVVILLLAFAVASIFWGACLG